MSTEKSHAVVGFSVVEKILITILAVMVFTLVIFPFYWIILTSFKNTLEIYEIPPRFIPKRLDFFNYFSAFKQYGIGKFLLNSMKVTLSTIAGTLVVATCASYALARMEFEGSRQLRSFLGITQMFPVVVLLVPLFIFCNKLNLYDTLGSLVLPYIAMQTPVAIILMISYFSDVPKEMEEAAVIDGCNLFQIFTKVMLPLVVSGIVAVGIYLFIQVWQEFLIASSFITSRDFFTLTVGLTTFKGDEMTDWGALMATSVIIAVPAILLFTTSQDFFTNRMAGGVKE
ncbi:MAG: carbohydrate ABC transporter permease [Sphaerochaetaceae bacterium]